MDLNTIIWLCVFCIAPFILTKIINVVFRKIYQKKNNLLLYFLKNLINAVIFMISVFGILRLFDKDGIVGQQILMSSSVIAIVLGIVFQTGLTNIMHGVIIVMYKPFNVGDRIQIDAGAGISGYVKKITFRHVVVTNVLDNADMIIPNSVVDSSVIKNLTNGDDANNRYPLIVSMTYEQAQDKAKRELAKHIISECILANPRTADTRENKDEDLFVKVDLAESSVNMTCFVTTNSAENNIVACSEIKEAILDRFAEEGLEFAYNHLEIVGHIKQD